MTRQHVRIFVLLGLLVAMGCGAGAATDAGGKESSLEDSFASIQTKIDTTIPDLTKEREIFIAFSCNQSACTFECRLDSNNWSSCSSPEKLENLEDGEHSFEVRAFDSAGIFDETPAILKWRVDTTPPETALSALAQEVTKETDATLTFQCIGETCQYECRMDGDAWSACNSPIKYIDLSEGEHQLEVRSIDLAGNVEQTPASFSWRIDLTAPFAGISTAPTNFEASSNASFHFQCNEASCQFECRLDAGSLSTCTSPFNVSGLGDGNHTFAVIAIDEAGNRQTAPALHAWNVDTVAPESGIDSGPSGFVPSDNAEFSVSCSEAVCQFECQLNYLGWSSCTSPVGYVALAEGPHSFEVRAIDQAGNVESSPVSRVWTVDTVTPATSLVAGPSGTVASSSASFSFECNESSCTFQCRIDAGSWLGCTSPETYTGLSEGEHTVAVRANDAAGNTEPVPLTAVWVVDTTGPDTTFESVPPLQSASNFANFSFRCEESPCTLECKLDVGEWAACASPHSYTDLNDGDHTVMVRGIDPVGNQDSSPATYTWHTDTTPPDTYLTMGPAQWTNQVESTFQFGCNESTCMFECSFEDGPWESCEGPVTYELTEGSYSFAVRASDAVANVDLTPFVWEWSVDFTPPSITSTTLANGAATITDASTTLETEALGAYQMLVTGDVVWPPSDWVPFESPLPLVLDEPFGIDGIRVLDTVPSGEAYTMEKQADGKYVVGGKSYNGIRNVLALTRFKPDGILDGSFGNQGMVLADVSTSHEEVRDIAIDPMGRLVVVGKRVIVRFHADGSLDDTFGGGDGVLQYPSSFSFESVLLTSDGKILVAGTVFNPSNTRFTLKRFHSDGTLDTSFNQTQDPATLSYGSARAQAMVLQPDGRILVLGTIRFTSGGDNYLTLVRYMSSGSIDTSFGQYGNGHYNLIHDHYKLGNSSARALKLLPDGKVLLAGVTTLNGDSQNMVLARFLANGTPDTSFGQGYGANGGIVVKDLGAYESVTSILVAGDGGILLGGSTFNGDISGAVVLRYHADGVLDTAFGREGIAVYSPLKGVNGMAFNDDGSFTLAGGPHFTLVHVNPDGGRGEIAPSRQESFVESGFVTENYGLAKAGVAVSDGRIVAAGGNGDFVLTRYWSDGTTDTSFGTNGTTSVDFAGGQDTLADLIVQPDGKLVAVGTIEDSSGTSIALARFTESGLLDTTFGMDGTVVTNISAADYASAIVLQTDGKLVVAGRTYNDSFGRDYFVVIRYLSDGSLDTSFLWQGIRPINTASDGLLTGIAVGADGKIVVVGQEAGGFYSWDFKVIRLLPNGDIDTTFAAPFGKLTVDFLNGSDYAQDVVIQTDGRILAAGYARDGVKSLAALVRINADGSLDSTFGVGGKVTTEHTEPGFNSTSSIRAYDIDLLPDGKIITVGRNQDDIILLQYLSTGALDTTFHWDGISQINVDVANYSVLGSADVAYEVAARPDGGFFTFGSSAAGFTVTRHGANGTLDIIGGSQGLIPEFMRRVWVSVKDQAGNLSDTVTDDVLIESN